MAFVDPNLQLDGEYKSKVLVSSHVVTQFHVLN